MAYKSTHKGATDEQNGKLRPPNKFTWECFKTNHSYNTTKQKGSKNI